MKFIFKIDQPLNCSFNNSDSQTYQMINPNWIRDFAVEEGGTEEGN